MSTDTPATITDEAWQAIWEARCELLNWAYITMRYHRKRQWFFNLLDKTTLCTTVIAGASLMGKTTQEHLPLLGAAVSIAGLLALVFGYGDRRQCHKDLADQAVQLIGQIESLPHQQLAQKHISEWSQARMQLSLKEPPDLKILVHKCEWEQAVAEGHTKPTSAPKWYRQAHMHFF